MKYQQKIKHWQSLFIQQQNSGLSISDFCKQQKFATSTFYAWKKRIAKIDGDQPLQTQKQQLIPLLLEDVPEHQNTSLKLTTPTGYQLEFYEGLPHQKLNRILSMLK
tara:strand:+ start:113 stop:433 length:321 start_codon:yes stop_codon:yes gene_type:complete